MGNCVAKGYQEYDYKEIVNVKAENWSKKFKKLEIDDVTNERTGVTEDNLDLRTKE